MASVTQAVVLPNMLATTSGRAESMTGSASTMPQMAPAARVKMTRERRLSPATSAMLGIMVMSFVPR